MIAREHNGPTAVDRKPVGQRILAALLLLQRVCRSYLSAWSSTKCRRRCAKTRCGGQRALAMQKLEPFMSCLPRDDLGRPCCTAEMHGRDARLVIGVGRTAVIMRCAARKA